MFFSKKKCDKSCKEDNSMDVLETAVEIAETMVARTKNEMLDIIFAVAMAGGIKTKKIADKFEIGGLKKFSEELLVEVENRIKKERERTEKILKESVKNVYDKAKTTPRKKKNVK